MNKFALFAISLAFTTAAHAATVAPMNERISPARIDQTIRLAGAAQDGNIKVNIIIEDRGLSTDVSPRYSIYLGYNSVAEMGNLSAAYLITELAYSNVSARRVAPGIYEVKYRQYKEEGMVTVTQRIDATAVFADDKAQRAKCDGDFCDGNIKANLSMTESVSK